MVQSMNPQEFRTQSKKDILPHTKVLIIAAVCISVIGISLSYKLSKERSSLILNETVTASAGKTAEEIENDKKIISALEDARIRSLGALASTTNPFAPTPKDTVSDRFAKDVFSAYLQYDQTGQLPDPDSWVNNLDYLDVRDVQKNKYSLAFLPVFSPKNPAEIKEYGNQFATLYLEAVMPVDKDLAKYQSDVKNLAPIYKNIGENLMKLKVPSPIASEHLELANQYLKQADAFLLVSGEAKDPAKALLGLKVVRDGMETQVEMFTRIKNYFKENGIIFEAGEPGNFWNSGNTKTSIQ